MKLIFKIFILLFSVSLFAQTGPATIVNGKVTYNYQPESTTNTKYLTVNPTTKQLEFRELTTLLNQNQYDSIVDIIGNPIVETVTGSFVNNTDSRNPIINVPDLQNITNSGNTTSNRVYFTDGTIDLSTINQTSVPTILSTKPNVLLANTFSDSDLVANHGFSDINRINKPVNNFAYNSFDALTEFTGSSNYDHYAGFQARPRYGSTGTINYIRGYAVEARITSGTVSLLDGLTIYDYTGTGGTVNQYAGVRVKSLSKAGINWALYTEGTTPSRLEGNLDLSTTAGVADAIQSVLRFNSGANHTPMATIHNQFASTSSGSLHFRVRNTSATGDSGLVEVMKINGGAVRSVDITGKATVSLAPTANTDVVRKLELDLKANIASPALTGGPTAPTASASTNSTQLATTAFVFNSTSYQAKTANYTLANGDYAIDFTSGSNTATLPTAVGITSRRFIIKNSGTGSTIIAPFSGQTIDGNSNMVLFTQNSAVEIQSDGANWKILGTYNTTSVLNTTMTTTQTAATLNSAYPNAWPPFVVYAPAITTGPMVFIKTTSGGQWIQYSGSVLNP